jgi:hypothetical protein
MKKFLFAMLLMHGVCGTTESFDSVVQHDQRIVKIEYDAQGSKKECKGLFSCRKQIPVKVTCIYEGHECIFKGYVLFRVDKELVVRDNKVILESPEVLIPEERNTWHPHGTVSLPSAEIIFADDERAHYFKESIDGECRGKTGSFLKKLDSHYYSRVAECFFLTAYITVAVGTYIWLENKSAAQHRLMLCGR